MVCSLHCMIEIRRNGLWKNKEKPDVLQLLIQDRSVAEETSSAQSSAYTTLKVHVSERQQFLMFPWSSQMMV